MVVIDIGMLAIYMNKVSMRSRGDAGLYARGDDRG